MLDYFDGYIIGLTATPSKQTFGFFNQNLVMEYGHEEAVADGVNVNYDVYRIRTRITEQGSTVESGYYVDVRERETRQIRWEQLDEDLAYDANKLDRDVVATDQIRTVISTFRDKLFTEIFSGRTDVSKTLIFAKDDSHAEDIVKIVREEFSKGNDFAQKITYKTTGKKPEDLIAEFRNSYYSRVAVTVDMIATGTDIKPLEVVMFMRSVKSSSFFEQMKGRGVRIINNDDLKSVTPDAKAKDHFIIVDAVGVCERDKTDSKPMDRKKTISFEKLLQAISLGNIDPNVISSVASRLARLDKNMSEEDGKKIIALTNGKSLGGLVSDLVNALNPANHVEKAKQDNPGADPPTHEQVKQAETKLIKGAVKPLYNPKLRNLSIETDDFEYAPFSQEGGLGKVYQLFDEELILLGEDGAPFFDLSKQKAFVIRGKSWVNNHAHVLRSLDNRPNNYIKYYLDVFNYHGYVSGTTRLKLNQTSMRKIPVPIAPLDEQKRIVAEIEKQFSRLDEAVDNLKRIKANLKRYKASVLKSAVDSKLTEEWRKANPDVEPAGKFLERILVERQKNGKMRNWLK